MTAFDAATAVAPAGPGRWTATVDAGWFAPAGPNGGYLASIVLRAMLAAVGDPARAPRSLTLHYLRAPAAGAVDVAVEVQRDGRSLSTLSARMEQEGRPCVLAVGAFATAFPTVADYAAPMPPAPPPEAISPVPPMPGMPPIFAQLETRPAIGPVPFSGGDEARSGGWLRLAEPREADAVAVATYADAWWPAPFTRLTAPVAAPTVDLTIHFRRALPHPGMDPAAPLLGLFTSRFSAEGFFEEDGELWSPDGVLLAQCRQLALLRPGRPGPGRGAPAPAG